MNLKVKRVVLIYILDIYASEQLEALPLEKLNSLNGDLFKPSNINTSHVVSRPEQFYVDPPHSQPKERKLEEISPILKSNGVSMCIE